MTKQYIRVKADGFIYEYNKYMAENPACELVSEEVAYPERFMPKTAARRKKGTLNLTTDDVPEAPAYTTPELAQEAAKGWPK